jgi:hypothetical protein
MTRTRRTPDQELGPATANGRLCNHSCAFVVAVNAESSSTSKSLISHVHFLMSQQAIDFLEEDYRVDRELGAINAIEAWWIERQEALERAGYMLRPRYRAGWKPSWEALRSFIFTVKTVRLKWYVLTLALTGSSIHEFSCVWAWMQLGSLTEDL